jgi:Flp pilus assembly protein TadG
MNKDASQLQKGQAIVLVALMIVALTGMLALSVDVGNSYTQRRSLQTAADAAAMAGAHLGMEQILNAGGTQDYAAQRATAIKFANLNGAVGSDTITIVWVDNTGAAFGNNGSNLPIIPGGKVVQGMKVTITANRNTVLFRALGILTVGVTVTAMAQFGTANALVGSSPLLMNNDTLGAGGTNPPLYLPFLVTTDNGGPACCSVGQTDSLGRAIPATFTSGSPGGPMNFHMLHDPPTDPVTLATRSSAANGISGTLSIGPSYYIDTAGQPADDSFALGMNDRINRSLANPLFGGDKPQAGKFSPYNPRVFMVAVNQDSSGASPTTIIVFLAFYIEFVLYDASHKVTIGGYWVNSSGVPGNGGLGVPTNGTGNPMVFRLTQ